MATTLKPAELEALLTGTDPKKSLLDRLDEAVATRRTTLETRGANQARRENLETQLRGVEERVELALTRLQENQLKLTQNHEPDFQEPLTQVLQASQTSYDRVLAEKTALSGLLQEVPSTDVDEGRLKKEIEKLTAYLITYRAEVNLIADGVRAAQGGRLSAISGGDLEALAALVAARIQLPAPTQTPPGPAVVDIEGPLNRALETFNKQAQETLRASNAETSRIASNTAATKIDSLLNNVERSARIGAQNGVAESELPSQHITVDGVLDRSWRIGLATVALVLFLFYWVVLPLLPDAWFNSIIIFARAGIYAAGAYILLEKMITGWLQR